MPNLQDPFGGRSASGHLGGVRTEGTNNPASTSGLGANAAYASSYTNPSPFNGYGRGHAGYPAWGGAYGAGYSTLFPGTGSFGYASYGNPFGATGGTRQSALMAGALSAREEGAAVLSGMQEAMQRFARVSGMLEEVLRSLHMLFDGIFGLGYSLGAFYDEGRVWLADKSGPSAFVVRALGRFLRLWRIVALFICSPLAGRFSAVELVLSIIGIHPDDICNEQSGLGRFGDEEQPQSEERTAGQIDTGQGQRTDHGEGPRNGL